VLILLSTGAMWTFTPGVRFILRLHWFSKLHGKKLVKNLGEKKAGCQIQGKILSANYEDDKWATPAFGTSI
jgi:hypothetical protein